MKTRRVRLNLCAFAAATLVACGTKAPVPSASAPLAGPFIDVPTIRFEYAAEILDPHLVRNGSPSPAYDSEVPYPGGILVYTTNMPRSGKGFVELEGLVGSAYVYLVGSLAAENESSPSRPFLEYVGNDPGARWPLQVVVEDFPVSESSLPPRRKLGISGARFEGRTLTGWTKYRVDIGIAKGLKFKFHSGDTSHMASPRPKLWRAAFHLQELGDTHLEIGHRTNNAPWPRDARGAVWINGHYVGRWRAGEPPSLPVPARFLKVGKNIAYVLDLAADRLPFELAARAHQDVSGNPSP